MPSQLTGRVVNLKWDDFKGTPPGNKAKELEDAIPGKNVFLAATFSKFVATFGGAKQANLEKVGSSFKLKDDVTLAVTFDQSKSWKVIDHLSVKGQGFLLDHEQGHYNITALMGRDCFIEIMALKRQTYSSELDGRNAVQTVLNQYMDSLNKIQSKYDWDTNHGTWNVPSMGPISKGAEQERWEGYIRKAFTAERPSGEVAPDGASYKLRLIDVARAGIVSRNETPVF